MRWHRISVMTQGRDVDDVCARLVGLGHDQLEIVDDVPAMREHLEQTSAFWDMADVEELLQNGGQTCIRFYVPESADLDGIRADIGVALDDPHVSVDAIEDDDWVERYKRSITAMAVGEKLLIRPDWDEAAYPGKTVLTLSPGLVFGTGDHQSTQLCLEAVQGRVTPGCRVLDLGCGSGILSIASLLLGAGEAVAVDVDPIAETAARENAAMNGAEGRMRVVIGNAVTEKRTREAVKGVYDIILINIVADVIIALLPFAEGMLKQGGVIITSGIIDDRTDDVARAAEGVGLMVAEKRVKDNWVGLVLTRDSGRQ